MDLEISLHIDAFAHTPVHAHMCAQAHTYTHIPSILCQSIFVFQNSNFHSCFFFLFSPPSQIFGLKLSNWIKLKRKKDGEVTKRNLMALSVLGVLRHGRIFFLYNTKCS